MSGSVAALAARYSALHEGYFLKPNQGMDLDDGDRECMDMFRRALPQAPARELWVAMLDQAFRDLGVPEAREGALRWIMGDEGHLRFADLAHMMGWNDGAIEQLRARARLLAFKPFNKSRFSGRRARRATAKRGSKS